MNSSMRRLASDQASLRSSLLPPNYFFDDLDVTDLTRLDVCLAGPPTTPFEAGLFRLHLAIPSTYPDEPPKAFFRTKIFHPNVDESTGAVCVETLKRDWDRNLTLRDVLLTINCLLLFPNPSSALNAEAGIMLEQEDGYNAFARRARFMTSIHAKVPADLKHLVTEAQQREIGTDTQRRKPRPTTRTNGAQEKKDQENRPATPPSSLPPQPQALSPSPTKTRHADLDSSTDSIEPEYPPSPKKSPKKGLLQPPAQGDLPSFNTIPAPDLKIRSTRARRSVMKRTTRGAQDFSDLAAVDKVRKPATRASPARAKIRSAEEIRKAQVEAELWDACGRDVQRWNRGDFGSGSDMKTPRW